MQHCTVERITRFAEQMKPGEIISARDAAARIGGRGINSRTIGSVLKALPYMEYVRLSHIAMGWKRL